MVHRMVFWAGFGLATRAWSLGIERRPILGRSTLWGYPVFAAIGASFGYWVQGVDERQQAILQERKQAILDKRARRAARQQEQAHGEPEAAAH
ncbi:NADH/ubiquinone oxidoreductase [Neurospora tetrasperma FGSC 2508]|uniref:NADH:ubiquinone oxidoreductase 10.4kD subunit n=2 Tax=Neurospora TaxID=5140 RepID=A0AAJ0MVP4_9PEZI|nr:NADH/ubiquinone oxidoreductase [Neurospora tetrasperma FGSC 2508]EGO60510.1 NADH/ubiquinone oxidoreductase [Neurospora tetrasperma FGSC 2508]EGZ75517.1 NADH:ubiquinone oxidoreductase 10.4kD subunit [Neurospora tetrasperma FGSC 2509]KAK3499959.1 NADH:ubiquinone oxidoreductase 10.4kD subunit [Neurospora hispaniola]